MIHNLDYIKDYYRWRDDVLKVMHKKRALAISKAAKLKMFRKLGYIKVSKCVFGAYYEMQKV